MATDKSFGCRFANTEKCADSCFKCELFHRDYISREAAIDAVDVGNLHRGIVNALQEIISDIPAADVRPVVRGHWIKRKGWDKYVCSECSNEEKAVRNFCPNCGADMREDDNVGHD